MLHLNVKIINFIVFKAYFISIYHLSFLCNWNRNLVKVGLVWTLFRLLWLGFMSRFRLCCWNISRGGGFWGFVAASGQWRGFRHLMHRFCWRRGWSVITRAWGLRSMLTGHLMTILLSSFRLGSDVENSAQLLACEF